jgi:hypothetical protein
MTHIKHTKIDACWRTTGDMSKCKDTMKHGTGPKNVHDMIHTRKHGTGPKTPHKTIHINLVCYHPSATTAMFTVWTAV